ncbi:MAG: hypothetical protein PHP08_00635 [Candidatus Dojkabacteria bacterium]|nr:hypothetical protein [Candidatus Dojkabacteria bacterium]
MGISKSFKGYGTVISESYIKIIVERLPKTVPKEIIEIHCNNYIKKGKNIKTEIRDDMIVLYFIQEMD